MLANFFVKLVLGEVRYYFTDARRNSKLLHVVLPLRDRFKGETGETFHFVVVTSKINSGLESPQRVGTLKIFLSGF